MNSLVKLLNKSLVLHAERTAVVAQLPRFLNFTNSLCKQSKKSVILSNLDIPEPPKKPLNGYFRFVQEIRSSASKAGKIPKEVLSIAAVEWKKLDESEKQKYIQESEKDKIAYQREKQAYEKNLTNEQKLAIAAERQRLRELKKERAKKQDLKKRMKEYGKPKRPLGSYFLFAADERKKGKLSGQELKAKFDLLNESQKKAYTEKAKILLEQYKNALAAWEKKMISKGMTDLVKKSAIKLEKRK